MGIRFGDTDLFFDIETHSAAERYAMPPQDFFRLGGYSWGESDEITVTEDYEEMLAVIRRARVVIGHNIHQFDLSVLFGPDSMYPLDMAREQRVLDTFTHATLAYPAPEGYYTGRDEKKFKSTTPGEYKKWYSLDNLAFQLGTDGKSASVTEIADRYLYRMDPLLGPDGEPVKFKSGKRKGETKTVKVPTGVCCGYGHIPLDLEEFREYLRQDVRATREVARGLLARHGMNTYAWYEQMKAGIDAQISRNGFRLDQELAQERVKDMAEVAAYGLNELHERFDLPLSGKMPLRNNEGKAALLRALASVGVKEMELERTANGAPSFGGDSVRKACGWVEQQDGTWTRPEDGNPEALDLAELVAILGGQRSLPELALASVHPDGKAHPSILPLQRSGRKSTTEPGFTIWDDNHKDYWIPDCEDEVIVEFDYSNADARIVAALSGDEAYAVRFEEGQDGHMINALAAWGPEVVKTNPRYYRQKGKPGGHAWGYRVGPAKLAKTLMVPFLEAKAFLDNLNRAFQGVVRWQNQVTEQADRDGFVVNDWGRIMPITGRAYTQAPALLGQSGTNEILATGLIKLPNRFIRMIKATIHDAVIFSMPRATLDRDLPFVIRCLSTTWKPRHGGQQIEFPVGHGTPGRTWKEAIH
jgi:DNA polymerase-1